MVLSHTGSSIIWHQPKASDALWLESSHRSGVTLAGDALWLESSHRSGVTPVGDALWLESSHRSGVTPAGDALWLESSHRSSVTPAMNQTTWYTPESSIAYVREISIVPMLQEYDLYLNPL